MTPTASGSVLVGVGNAGVCVLDRIAMEDPSIKGVIVINNDPESLTASVVEQRIVFPHRDAADFTDGFLVIEEDFARAIQGATSVILCGGLGGETGSFLLPTLAARAKADGITTLASVGIPFSFEGRRKRELAATALKKLHELCDGVAVIDNDRLSGGIPSTAAIGEAFVTADKALQSLLLALRGMLQTSGPVKITRTDLSTVLSDAGGMTHFGHGFSVGENRLHEALEAALKSPLLSIPGKGSALKEGGMLLLLISGPSDISFAEVQRAVSELERIAGDACQVKVGVHAQRSLGAPLDLFVLGSSASTTRRAASSENLLIPGRSERKVENPPEDARTTIPLSNPSSSSASSKVSRESKATKASNASHTTRPMKANTAQQTQGVFDLGSYQRGRFDKSEPTIVAGEDLDIPTFLRKGVKLPGSNKR